MVLKVLNEAVSSVNIFATGRQLTANSEFGICEHIG